MEIPGGDGCISFYCINSLIRIDSWRNMVQGRETQEARQEGDTDENGQGLSGPLEKHMPGGSRGGSFETLGAARGGDEDQERQEAGRIADPARRCPGPGDLHATITRGRQKLDQAR